MGGFCELKAMKNVLGSHGTPPALEGSFKAAA